MFCWNIFGFAILTTLGLQILSNFANDYGDGVKGTDNEDRVGPKRAIQSNHSCHEKGNNYNLILTLCSAMALIYYAFTDTNLFYSLFYLVLGILAIFSAIRYVGNSLHTVVWRFVCICLWFSKYLGC
jgi:1,4-dihydroxy-2-naphthoate octaprenyltransferase